MAFHWATHRWVQARKAEARAERSCSRGERRLTVREGESTRGMHRMAREGETRSARIRGAGR